MRYEIFCPKCAMHGKRKKLMEVDENAKGTIYPYCKVCKENIKIDLVPKCHL